LRKEKGVSNVSACFIVQSPTGLDTETNINCCIADSFNMSAHPAFSEAEKTVHDDGGGVHDHDLDHDPEHAAQVQSDRLNRALSARQVQMIAIGGTIGTGLFLGTGKSLATGGPASVLIAYLIVGGIIFTTMLSLGEMAAFMPIAGSFGTYAG
jgi:amino acid permease